MFYKLEQMFSIEDWCETDRVTALSCPYALDIDLYLDLWPWLSIPGELWSWVMTHTQTHKLKFKGQHRFKR